MGLLGYLSMEFFMRDFLVMLVLSAIVATLLSLRFYLRITAGRCYTEVIFNKFSSLIKFL